jgi:transposase
MSQSISIKELLKTIEELSQKINILEHDVQKLKILEKENKTLKKENKLLTERLLKYEVPKNSRNSSIPPSKDENRPFKNKSLRKKTGRKPGGQPGHEGTTLQMAEQPDKIKEHKPCYCTCCGRDLRHQPYEFVERRQVIDLPEIKSIVTEHRVYMAQCLCGHKEKAEFPVNVNATVSYGPVIESLVGYFHTRQYVPYQRMQELFHDIFSVPISEGGIHYLLERLTQKALPVYQWIKERLLKSNVIGCDETGAKLNGKKIWMWTFQNNRLTWNHASGNRGYKTLEGQFPDGLENAVLVHDCWKSYFKVQAQNHQLCTAHLLRELNYLSEKYKQTWPLAFKEMLVKAIELKKKLKPADYYHPMKEKDELKNRLNYLLTDKLNEKHKELLAFQKRMIKYQDSIFTFLYHPKVPPDNNSSEQAIRNVKVKQKVSGQFRSWNGAVTFAVLRSIADTALKNGQKILNAYNTIANFA